MTDISSIGGMTQREWYEREYLACKDFLDEYNSDPSAYNLDQDFILGVIESMSRASGAYTCWAYYERITRKHTRLLVEYPFAEPYNSENMPKYSSRIAQLVFAED